MKFIEELIEGIVVYLILSLIIPVAASVLYMLNLILGTDVVEVKIFITRIGSYYYNGHIIPDVPAWRFHLVGLIITVILYMILNDEKP